jgi:YD repeat-containing protein
MLSPFVKNEVLSTPGGRTRTLARTRTVSQLDPADLMSFATLTDTTTQNGKSFIEVFAKGPRTLTRTTPLGRQIKSTLDAAGRVRKMEVPKVLPVELGYDAHGRLETVTQGSRVSTRAYRPDGYLASVTDALVQTTVFTPNAVGRVLSELRPDNNEIVRGYDAVGNLTAVTPPDRPQHELGYTDIDRLELYDPPDLPTGPTPTSWDYNVDGQLDRVIRPGGDLLDVGHDDAGRRTSVASSQGTITRGYHPVTGTLQTLNGPAGIHLTFGYDGHLLTDVTWSGAVSGALHRVFDNDLRIGIETINGMSPVHYDHDADGLLTGAAGLVLIRDPQNGRLTGTTLGTVTETVTYNDFGEVEDRVVQAGAATLLSLHYNRDPLRRISEKTETLLGETHAETYFYDAAGRLTDVFRDGVLATHYELDANGNRLSRTTASESEGASHDDQDRLLTYGTKSYTYRDSGELLSRTDTATGATTRYDYDAFGNLRSVTLPGGTTIEYAVDGLGRRVGKKVNGALVKGWLYGGALRPVAELDASGAVVVEVFAKGPRTLTRTTPFGRQTKTTLDAAGRVRKMEIPKVLPVELGYDAHGRLETVTQGSRVSTRAYRSDGYLDRVTDALVQTTVFTPDAVGRVLSELRPDSKEIARGYDAVGNLTAVTPPERPMHELGYTDVDLLELYDPPDLPTGPTPTSWAYNLDGQLDWVTRPGGDLLDIGHEDAGQQSSAASSHGTLTRGYHPVTGKLETLSGPAGITLTFSYDGHLLTDVTWSGVMSGALHRVFDNDLRIDIETINGANPIHYDHDADGLLTGAGGLVLTRDPQNGRLTGTTLGALTETITYNEFGDVEDRIVHTGATTLLSLHYERDPLGRISEKTETLLGETHVETYFYDAAGRLTDVFRDGVLATHYEVDANGNRLSRTTASESESTSHDDQDRLLTLGTKSYAYRDSGELLSRTETATGATTLYDYDAFGNLRSVTLPGATAIEYVVDGLGRRVGKKVNGALVKGWLYGGALRPVAELDASGAVVARFAYGQRVNVPEVMSKAGHGTTTRRWGGGRRRTRFCSMEKIPTCMDTCSATQSTSAMRGGPGPSSSFRVCSILASRPLGAFSRKRIDSLTGRSGTARTARTPRRPGTRSGRQWIDSRASPTVLAGDSITPSDAVRRFAVTQTMMNWTPVLVTRTSKTRGRETVLMPA